MHDTLKPVVVIGCLASKLTFGSVMRLTDDVRQVLKASTDLARQYELSRKNKNQMIRFIRVFRKTLEGLAIGQCLFVPAAFGTESFSPLILLLERTGEEAFTVAVINSGDGAMEYHISSPVVSPPKFQTRMVMSFPNVAREKVLQDGWWFMFFRLGHFPA